MEEERRETSMNRLVNYYLKHRHINNAPICIHIINEGIKKHIPIKIRSKKGEIEILISKVPVNDKNKLDFNEDRGLEYISYFGYSDLSRELYPTIEKICREYKTNYNYINHLPRLNTELERKVLIKPEEEKIYIKNISNEEADYLEFCLLFGENRNLYNKLKLLRKSEVSWKEIKNLRFGDIDFEKRIVHFKNNER